MKDKKYLIYGGGVSGKDCLQYLLENQFEVGMIVKENEKFRFQNDNIPLYGIENFDSSILEDYDIVIRSPGIGIQDKILQIMINKKMEILSEIEFAFRLNNKGKYIAITGSNGKTTTVSLLYDIVKLSTNNVILGGNIGKTLISQIKLINEDTIVILELSSFQLENCPTFKPFIFAITNLSPNHLDKCGDLNYYYNSKLSVLKQLDQNCYFIKNIDDEILQKEHTQACKEIKITLKDEKQPYYSDHEYIYDHLFPVLKLTNKNLLGKHNSYNILMCYAICKLLQVNLKHIQLGYEQFPGVELRMQLIKTIRGVEIYNDGKSTTPYSTLAAVETFQHKKIHLLMGGRNKGLNLGIVQNEQIVTIYAFGEAAKEIYFNCKHVKVFPTIAQAYITAKMRAKKGEVILFSPSCASFDQFENYIQRGHYFTNLVVGE